MMNNLLRRNALTVSQVNSYIRQLMDNDAVLGETVLRAEVSNFKRHSSGHLYFTLKDESSAIGAVMFQKAAAGLGFGPENGMEVTVFGYISVYEKTGQYQVYAEYMEPSGIGGLYFAFEQMKKKLDGEGLFSYGYKKPLPAYLSRVAVITSPTGAAVRDVINVAGRRNGTVSVIVVPVLVQGEQAAESIVKAIEDVNRMRLADVIILGRGGGSIEDLWAFNEEAVARAVFGSAIPVVSAVGHETDFTITDFTADMRAPTPSAAAEMAVPSLSEMKGELAALKERLKQKFDARLLLPLELINRQKLELSQLCGLLGNGIENFLGRRKTELAHVTEIMEKVSPANVLKRGFAIVAGADGRAVSGKDGVAVGDRIRITVADGVIGAEVVEML